MKYYFYFGLIILFLRLTCSQEFKVSIENQLIQLNHIVNEINKKSQIIFENKSIKNLITVNK